MKIEFTFIVNTEKFVEKAMRFIKIILKCLFFVAALGLDGGNSLTIEYNGFSTAIYDAGRNSGGVQVKLDSRREII